MEYPLAVGYFKNVSIPGTHQQFICGNNILLAHSQAYRLGKSMMPNALISYKNNGGCVVRPTKYKSMLTRSTQIQDSSHKLNG